MPVFLGKWIPVYLQKQQQQQKKIKINKLMNLSVRARSVESGTVKTPVKPHQPEPASCAYLQSISLS